MTGISRIVKRVCDTNNKLIFVQLSNCLVKNFVPRNRDEKITSNGRCPFEVSRFSLRPAPLPPQGVGRNTLSAQSVFRHAHVAAKNDLISSLPAGSEFCEAFGMPRKKAAIKAAFFLEQKRRKTQKFGKGLDDLAYALWSTAYIRSMRHSSLSE